MSAANGNMDFDTTRILYSKESINGIKHRWSIVFESAMCDLLHRMGCGVIPEPPLDNNGRGDFLVTDPNGDEFYLEATVLHPEHLCIAAQEMDACRKLNSMCRNPYFRFTAVVSGYLKDPLGRRDLCQITDWVESLPHDSGGSSRTFNFASGVGKAHYRHDWSITINAYPSAERIPDGRISFLSSVRRELQAGIRARMQNKIKEKRKQYRGSNLPVVMAMNDMLDRQIAGDEMVMALFGRQDMVKENMYRISMPPGGYLQVPCWSRSRNTTVSAIAAFRRWTPGDEFDVCLFVNPWARYPVPDWVQCQFPSTVTHEHSGEIVLQLPGSRSIVAQPHD